MNRAPLVFLLLIFIVACNFSDRKNDSFHYTASSDTAERKTPSNIRFEFTAERRNASRDIVDIKASLFNDNIDTVYFLSSTCGGEQYSLRSDSAGCALTTLINCNASYPVVIKIAPKGRHDLQANFRCDSNTTRMKLGFDFYTVDRSFNIAGKNIGEINIFNRPSDEQTIIWADETSIIKP
jgi:hypothetical protein